MEINPQRLLRTLGELRKIGACETGVHRPAFSGAGMQARERLVEEMEAAGLEASIDGVGNVFGKMKRASRCVLIGSHTDSVPRGRWLDRALGVAYGIESRR